MHIQEVGVNPRIASQQNYRLQRATQEALFGDSGDEKSFHQTAISNATPAWCN